MKKLQVLKEPDPKLRQVSKPVELITDEIRTFLDDMVYTMHEEEGIGLAAPQVGVLKRIIVIQLDEEEPAYKMINPEIIHKNTETCSYNEGCLSVPEERVEIKRPSTIQVNYLDENGNKKTLEAHDLFAVCIQHEIDHLNGVLLIDYLSPLKKAVALKRLRKLKNNHDLL